MSAHEPVHCFATIVSVNTRPTELAERMITLACLDLRVTMRSPTAWLLLSGLAVTIPLGHSIPYFRFSPQSDPATDIATSTLGFGSMLFVLFCSYHIAIEGRPSLAILARTSTTEPVLSGLLALVTLSLASVLVMASCSLASMAWLCAPGSMTAFLDALPGAMVDALASLVLLSSLCVFTGQILGPAAAVLISAFLVGVGMLAPSPGGWPGWIVLDFSIFAGADDLGIPRTSAVIYSLSHACLLIAGATLLRSRERKD